MTTDKQPVSDLVATAGAAIAPVAGLQAMPQNCDGTRTDP